MRAVFARRFYASELIGLAFGAPVAILYVVLLMDFGPAAVTGGVRFAVLMIAVVVLGLALPTNYLLLQTLRGGLDALAAGTPLGRGEMTRFYMRLMRLPVLHGSLIFARIGLGAAATIVYLAVAHDASFRQGLMAMILCLYGGYLAGVIAYVVLGSMVSPVARALVAGGSLDPSLTDAGRFYGLSVVAKYVVFLLVPIVLTSFTLLLSLRSSWDAGTPYPELVRRTSGAVLVNVVTLGLLAVFSMRSTTRPLETLRVSLTALSTGGARDGVIPTDLSDEFAYAAHLMNRAVASFREILGGLGDSSAKVNVAIQELGAASQQVSATSNQQAAGVKEIVSTMEDSDQLSRQIATRIDEVVAIAEKTKETVDRGFDIIRETLEKMEAIRGANTQNTQGIRLLSDRIESIWEIVTIINDIADQTKIIAFNAELEAASAGDAGRNFQIVASEIRRLADSTFASTNEIKSRIGEIQNSSDHLILASEEGTNKVNAGWELSGRLRTLFEDILSSSEISADSARQIAGSISQQASAFGQILLTLRQISTGIESFAGTARSTARLTKGLAETAEGLERLVGKYDLGVGAARHVR
jgi:methyl-accepting chemotaxis protein